MQTIIQRMDKEGLMVKHQELYSISYENHNGKQHEKVYLYV